jgi:TolA-binding protein
MDAIKKKMQAMKLEKDNALDRALLCEQQARDANTRAEKAEEEARTLQKKIQTIENDLDQTQEQETAVNGKLEEKEKALQNVSDESFLSNFFLIAGNFSKATRHEKPGKHGSWESSPSIRSLGNFQSCSIQDEI